MSRTTRIVASIAFILLTSVLIVLGYMMYRLETARAELALSQREIAEIQAREASFTQLSRDLEETKSDREALEIFLIKPDDVVGFLSLIETLGAGYSTTVSTASLTVAEESEAFDTLRIEIKVIGPMEGVLQVLKALETLPYASRIDAVTLAAAGGEQGGWEGDLVLYLAEHSDI